MGQTAITYHLRRIIFLFGRRLKVGNRRYRLRSYLPSDFSVDVAHEKHLATVLTRVLASSHGPFIDVGVNNGQTLLKVLSIDPSREYIGFEPQLGCCFYVDQFLRDNNISHSRVVSVALSDENKMVPIYASGRSDEMASMVPQHEHGHPAPVRFYASARIGDEVLAELGVRPSIIKVDVEGAELNVFRGLSRTISDTRPICFFEVLPNVVGPNRAILTGKRAEHYSRRARELMTFFIDAEYRVFKICHTGEECEINDFSLDDGRTRDFVAYPRGDLNALTCGQAAG